MDKSNETIDDKAVAILAGLSINDKEIIEYMLKNINNLLFIEGLKHYKEIFYCGKVSVKINITFVDMDILIPAGKLDNVHESYRINFDHVSFCRLVGRDLFAWMSSSHKVPIRRPDAKAFKEKCRKNGKGRCAK